MRSCSRASAGRKDDSCRVSGSATCRLSGVLVQAVSSRPSASVAPNAPPIRLSVIPSLLMLLFDDLDLLRPRRFNDRPVALLDPSTHPHAAAVERFRLKAGGGKDAPVSF